MSICQVVDDLELFFTRPLDLSPAEEHEKNRQEAKALENEMKVRTRKSSKWLRFYRCLPLQKAQ